MPEEIKWAVTFDITAGPKVYESQKTPVDAYDKISVVVAPGTSDVELQPGTANKVSLLVIKSSKYDKKLTYSPDAGTTTYAVDGPHVLIGAGAVALLKTDPKTLQFVNGTTEDIAIDILVGREASA